MKKRFLKDITRYGSIAGALLSCHNLEAQIIYTDIPDDTLGLIQGPPPFFLNQLLNIDMNQDGTNDFEFRQIAEVGTCSSSSSYGGTFGYEARYTIKINKFNTGLVATATSFLCGSNIGRVKNYNSGDVINMIGQGQIHGIIRHITDGDCVTCMSGIPIGGDYYLGVRLVTSTGLNNGWIRYKVLGDMKIVVKDYALEISHAVPIIAGDSVSINTFLEELFPSLSVIITGNSLQVHSDTELNGQVLSIYDMSGRVIKLVECSGNTEEIRIEKSGMYILECTGDKLNYKKKIFIY